MSIQYINTGTAPNQGNGDSLRLAFTKINNNFAILADNSFAYDAVGQVIDHPELQRGISVTYNPEDQAASFLVNIAGPDTLGAVRIGGGITLNPDTGLISVFDGNYNNLTNIPQALGTTASPTFADLHVTGSLDIAGETTIINATVIETADLTITLAKDATSESAANTAGIIVNGPETPASLRYAASNDSWNFNKRVNIPTLYVNGQFFSPGNIGDLTVDLNVISTANQDQDIILNPDGNGRVLVQSNVLPNTPSTYDLGSTSSQWRTVYAEHIIVNGTELGGGGNGYTGSIGYTGSVGSIGYTGSVGTNGYTGSVGTNGYTGSQGIQGPVGPDTYTPTTPTNWIGSTTVATFTAGLDELANRIVGVESLDLLNLTSSLIPAAGQDYDLGNTSSQWRSLYVGSGTIYQGTAYDNIEYPDTSIRVDADTNSYAQMVMQNHNTGTTASTDLVIMNDLGNNFDHIIDLGINSSNYNTALYSVTGPNDGYLFVNGGDLVIGTQSPGQKLVFHVDGTTSNDSGGFLDTYGWTFNRSTNVIVSAPLPVGFRVQNTSNNVEAKATLQVANNTGAHLQIGINSDNPGITYGRIGPNDSFIHNHETTSTLHIGGAGDLAFYSNEATEYSGTPTLVMSRLDQSSTFAGHVLPNSDLTYDLGSTSSQWRSIYVGTGTIYIGGVALGVNQDNFVTVDGNPIITVNTAGNLTVQGNTNVVLGAVAISDIAPEATTPGSQWFNTLEARTYVAYNDQWVDSSPTVLAPSDTNPTLESVTFNDATVQTTAWPGVLSYNDLTDKPVTPTFVGGGGASTWLTAE